MDKGNFFEISEWKTKVVDMLQKQDVLANIKQGGYTVEDTQVPSLLHFIYKSKIQVQFTTPELSGIYLEDENKKRLHRLYQHLHDRMHHRARPLKLYYMNGEKETLLGWVRVLNGISVF